MTTAAPSDDSVDGAAGENLPDTPTRRWAKTDATQQRILDATTGVFAARGFTAAMMADIVGHARQHRQHLPRGGRCRRPKRSKVARNG
jgi:hypothetical protein